MTLTQNSRLGKMFRIIFFVENKMLGKRIININNMSLQFSQVRA